jgi:thiol-disulfide isomerase/thioredoxin
VEFLAAAIVIVGAVAVLNLVLTFGVIRRLREHTDLLGNGADASRGAPTMACVGETIAPFTAMAVDGCPVTLDWFEGPTLVGVFAPGCEACEATLPVFAEHARSFPGGRQNVLALVVASDETDATRYTDPLAEVVVVVRDDHHGPLSTALRVTGYPAFALVDPRGTVTASALDPSRLPSPATDTASSR